MDFPLMGMDLLRDNNWRFGIFRDSNQREVAHVMWSMPEAKERLASLACSGQAALVRMAGADAA